MVFLYTRDLKDGSDEYVRQFYRIAEIHSDECTVIINFAGNLDLYWNVYPNKKSKRDRVQYSFEVDESVPYLYDTFVGVFDAISQNKPYYNSLVGDEEFREKVLPKYLYSDKIELRKGNSIIWKSDDFYSEVASYVKITKAGNKFKITMHKSTSDEERNTFSVRFRNSGSRYNPYNTVFMSQFDRLCKFDNQISIFEQI